MQRGRSPARPPRPSSWPDDRRDGIDQRLQQLRVIFDTPGFR
jgi:hypothetical protein